MSGIVFFLNGNCEREFSYENISNLVVKGSILLSFGRLPFVVRIAILSKLLDTFHFSKYSGMFIHPFSI